MLLERTVSKISQAEKNSEKLKSPKKDRYYYKRVTNTATLNTSTVYNIYQRKQHITIQSLWSQLKDRELLNGSSISLRGLLKGLGFKWIKDNPRFGLMELPNVALKRVEFLRSYKQAKDDDALYQFVSLRIFQNGTVGVLKLLKQMINGCTTIQIN